jgi:PadR family transcriptional regulator, regulatory protein AphA
MKMELHVVRIAEKQYLAGIPGKKLIQTEADVNHILEACYENDTNRVLLYAENFSDHFFDLSSGEAGMILQKFAQYFVKAAAVLCLDEVPHTQKFEELVLEVNRGNEFRVFQNLQQAEQWLLKD